VQKTLKKLLNGQNNGQKEFKKKLKKKKNNLLLKIQVKSILKDISEKGFNKLSIKIFLEFSVE
jgi:hypothetical protein